MVAARIELIGAKDEAIEAKEAHKRDAAELAAAEMPEMGTKAELERALSCCCFARTAAHEIRDVEALVAQRVESGLFERIC